MGSAGEDEWSDFKSPSDDGDDSVTPTQVLDDELTGEAVSSAAEALMESRGGLVSSSAGHPEVEAVVVESETEGRPGFLNADASDPPETDAVGLIKPRELHLQQSEAEGSGAQRIMAQGAPLQPWANMLEGCTQQSDDNAGGGHAGSSSHVVPHMPSHAPPSWDEAPSGKDDDGSDPFGSITSIDAAAVETGVDLLHHGCDDSNDNEGGPRASPHDGESEKAGGDGEADWEVFGKPEPAERTTATVAVPSGGQPESRPSNLPPSSDEYDCVTAPLGEPQSHKLEISIAPPPAAGADAPPLPSDMELDPSAISWASPAHGIWRRDGDDSIMNAPAEKVDGEWVDVAADQDKDKEEQEGEKTTSDEGTCPVDRDEQRSEENSPTQVDRSLQSTAGRGGADAGKEEQPTLEKVEESFPSSCSPTDVKADGNALTGLGEASGAHFEASLASDHGPDAGGAPAPNDPGSELIASSETEDRDAADVAPPDALLDWGDFGTSLSPSVVEGVTETSEPPTGSDGEDLVEVIDDRNAVLPTANSDTDWGGFGNSMVDMAAATFPAFPESLDVPENIAGSAEEADWSAFEAPPVASLPRTHELESPRSVEGKVTSEAPLDTGREEGGGTEEGNIGHPEPLPLPPPVADPDESTQQSVSLDSAVAVHVDIQLQAVTDTPADDRENAGPGPSRSSQELASLQVPTERIDDEQNPHSISPGPEASGTEGDTWGAFDEGVNSASAAMEKPVASNTSEELVVSEEVSTAEPAVAQAAGTAGAEEATVSAAEVEDEVAAEEGCDVVDQEPESEEEWSDFGDFEEAPTPGESEMAPSEAAAPATSTPSLPVLASAGRQGGGTAVGGLASTRSTASGHGITSSAAVPVPVAVNARGTRSGDTAPLVPEGTPRTLATMMALFNNFFSAGESATAVPISLLRSGAVEESSLDSLVDLPNFLRHTQPARIAPGRLDTWAKACILRGIRPVQDALAMEDSDEDIDAGGGGRDVISATVRSASSAGPAIPASSPARSLPAEPPAQPASPTRSPPPSSVSPPQLPPREVGISQSVATRPVSPSSAPPPLPSKLMRREPTKKKEEEEEEEEGKDDDDVAVVVVVPVVETVSFASFPSTPEPPISGDPEVAWGESTPDMPRYAPPRVPSPPIVAEDRTTADEPVVWSGGSGGADDGVDGADAHTVAADVAAGDADDDWDGDPFDEFQCAPSASPLPPPPPPKLPTAPTAEENPSPPAEPPAWNLDFLMAAPAKGVTIGAEGKGGMFIAPGFGAGMPVGEDAARSGKPLDLVSQALAGFGIAGEREPGQASSPRDPWLTSAEPGSSKGRTATGSFAEEGTERAVSVELSDLLRTTRLRGGARRGARSPPTVPLSAAAQSRLATLPDLSFMLSQRIRFPMRATGVPTPGGGAT